MKVVSATEAKQTFGALLDAARREPIIIQKQNRNVAALIAIEDLNRIRQMDVEELHILFDEAKRQSREAGLTEEKLNELLDDE